MTRTLTVTIPGAPRAWERPRFDSRTRRTFTSPASRANMQAIALHVGAALGRGEPFAGPLRVELTFTLPVRESWPAWKRAAALAGDWRATSKPDVDNLAKAVKDACNGVAWVDDAQVVELVASKRCGAEPSTVLHVVELPQAARD